MNDLLLVHAIRSLLGLVHRSHVGQGLVSCTECDDILAKSGLSLEQVNRFTQESSLHEENMYLHDMLEAALKMPTGTAEYYRTIMHMLLLDTDKQTVADAIVGRFEPVEDLTCKCPAWQVQGYVFSKGKRLCGVCGKERL